MPFRGGASDAESVELQERRLHALVDHVPALLAYWDRNCHNVLANARYVEWFGRSPEEMHGMHIREVLGTEVYEKNLPFIRAVLQGEPQLFERTLIDTSGAVRHTQASYVPDVIDGMNYGFFALVIDITPRVEAQRAMDEAQRLAQLGSWSMDLETGIITWSDELYRIFGVDPESFVPTVDGLLERVDPEDVERVRAQVKESSVSGRDYDLEYRVHGVGGQVRQVHSRGHPVRGLDGRVLRLTGTVQDVTDTNNAARDLSRANRDLQRLNELNADVLAMLGHDVRAPLSVILGYLEALTDNWDETSEAQRRRYLERAYASATQLRALVEDILAMARVDSGHIVANAVELNVLDPIREAISGVTGERDITVVAAGVPRVFADPFHVRQVISNLVTNAVRYGEPPIVVQVEVSDRDTVTISVTDHGPGVPEDQVEELFQRFASHHPDRQLAGTETSTGFGLYIAAGLADANHGSLTYDGSAGGARFCLKLPRRRLD